MRLEKGRTQVVTVINLTLQLATMCGKKTIITNYEVMEPENCPRYTHHTYLLIIMIALIRAVAPDSGENEEISGQTMVKKIGQFMGFLCFSVRTWVYWMITFSTGKPDAEEDGPISCNLLTLAY